MYVFAIVFLGLIAPVFVIVILPGVLKKRREKKLYQIEGEFQEVFQEIKRAQLKPFDSALKDPKLGELGEAPKVPELEDPAPGGPFRGAK